MKCLRCNGSGKVVNFRYMGYTYKKKCGKCGGCGKLPVLPALIMKYLGTG